MAGWRPTTGTSLAEAAARERRDAEAATVGRVRGPIGAPSAAQQPDGLTPDMARVLDLQRNAGNRAVLATLQRRPARAPARTLTRAEDRQETNSLLNGFETLGAAAIDEGGKHLDTIPFGRDLSPEHRVLLEQIQHAMILAQESSPDSRRSAIEQWPALAAKLQAALDHGKVLGLSGDRLAVTADNLAIVSEQYIHAPHRGPTQVANADDYAELIGDTDLLLRVVDSEWTDKRSGVVPTNLAEVNAKQRQALGAVQLGPHLVKRHRDLLENLRAALIQARTNSPGAGQASLSIWQSIQGEYSHAFRVAPNYLETQLSPIQDMFKRIGAELILGGAYTEAHQKALAESNLEAPDVQLRIEKFKEAAEGFDQLHELALKAAELTGRDAISIVLQSGEFDKDLGPAIFELVKSPGELYAKYKEFKEKGIIGKAVSLAEIVDKTLALRNAVIKVACTAIKRFAETAAESALKAGLEEAASQWKKIGEWAEGKLSILEKLGKSVLVISLVVSAIKIVDAIRQGHWGEALKEAGNAAMTVGLYAVEGAGGTALIGGIAVIIAAEIDGISGAAAMIRYCEDQNVHSAATSFIGICQAAADIEAKDLVADARLLPVTHEREQRAFIESRLNGYRPYWMRHIEALSALVSNDRPSELGGQPKVRAALGPEALNLLASPETWAGSWEAMADQIRILFSASNKMTRYVNEHYSHVPKKEDA